MALEITCPGCGEEEDLRGERDEDDINVTCGSCGVSWTRSLVPTCDTCGGGDLQTVPLAILERSRGTQLSVVGIRMVDKCRSCDREDIERWQKHLPRPLMPADLPTLGTFDPDSVA